jgi:CAAX amino terminal protease family.
VFTLAQLVTASDVWAATVFVVLAAPVIEELFFRRLLIDRLRGYGQRAAVAVPALAFALVHGNFTQVFYAFFLGLALGYVYIRTHRIGYTIMLHMAINALGSLAPLVTDEGRIFSGVYGLLMLTGLIYGFIQFNRYKKQIGFSDESGQNQPIAWKKEAFLNAGMLLFFAVSAALFAWSTIYALQ